MKKLNLFKYQNGNNISKDKFKELAEKIRQQVPLSKDELNYYKREYVNRGLHKDSNGEKYYHAQLPEVEVTAKRIPYTQGLPTPHKLMSGYADMAGQVMNTPAALVGEVAHLMSGRESNLARAVPQQLNPYSKHWQGNKGTPEQRNVSDALNIQNPVGRFAVDMVTDPSTWMGAGAVKNATKIKPQQFIDLNTNIHTATKTAQEYRKPARDYINLVSSEKSLERAKQLDLEHGTEFSKVIPEWKQLKQNQDGFTHAYNIKPYDKQDFELMNNAKGYSGYTDESIKRIAADAVNDAYAKNKSYENIDVDKYLNNAGYDKIKKYERIIRLNPTADKKHLLNNTIPHELKHDLTYGNELLTDSYKNAQKKFLKSKEELPKDYNYDYYSDATELDAHLSTNQRQKMINEGILKDHFDNLNEEQLDNYLKSKGENKHPALNVIGDKLEQRKAFVDWFNKALPAAGTGVIANEALKDKKQMGGSISELGYKDNSPYKNASELPIHSPNGTITMDNVSKPLMVTDIDNNETRILNPNSGIHQFKGTNFIEKPINNMIPNRHKPTDRLLWQESLNKSKLKHGGYAQPHEVINKAMDIYAAKRGGWIMKAQGGGYNDPTNGTDYSGAPKPERNIFNSGLYADEDATFQDEFSGINPEINERFAATATRLPAGSVTSNPSMMSGNVQSKNNPTFNRAADANFEADDKFKNYQGRTGSSQDVDYNDEIFNRGSNSQMQGFPNSEKTKMYERKFQSDYRGKPVMSETVSNRTGGGERRGDKTASSSKGASGNMFLNQDLRDYGYTDETGNLTDKAFGVLSEADSARAREMGLSAKELLSNEDLGDDTKESFRATILQKGLGKDRADKAAYMNARKTMNETLKHLERINPEWKELSSGEKARLSNIENEKEFIQKYGSDLRTISDYRRGYGTEVDRKPVVTADVDSTDTEKSGFNTSGNLDNKPNAYQGNEQGSRYSQANNSNNNIPSKPRTGTGNGQRRSSSRGSGLPSRRPQLSYDRGARKNMSEVRANGNASGNNNTTNTTLKGSTYTPKSYKAVGSTLKRQEGGYSYNYNEPHVNDRNNTMGNYSNQSPAKYSPGDLVYYQKGGNIEQGVVKFFDSSTGKVHLH